jgi:hypothetical protein
MTYQHKNLAAGRWQELSFFEQMANIGSEVERSMKWKDRNKEKYFEKSFERAIELFDLTIEDKRNLKRLKEIIRAKELFIDFIKGDNIFRSKAKDWQKYFYAFNFAARISA